ncbi:MAG: pyruvate kinase, partial [Chloroflexi bacterium]|nr:pyruvate kinase [Chloroflexota bacterium]
MRRAKIVATIGPASDSIQVLESLIKAGMNVARLNFSHGTHEQHQARVAAIRAAAKKLGMPVGILQDLQGPKIRVGKLA